MKTSLPRTRSTPIKPSTCSAARAASRASISRARTPTDMVHMQLGPSNRTIGLRVIKKCVQFLPLLGRTVCKTVRPKPSDRCLSVCHVCDVRALWPNGWTDQDETCHAGRPRPCHSVLDGDPVPPPQRGAPNFRPISVAAKWLHGSRCHLVWS